MRDTELVQRLKDGDRSAFDQIYEKYHRMLYHTALLIIGNRQDAEDALQETFVSCYLHIRDLRNEESLKSWLFQIMARNARKAGKKASKETPDDEILRRIDEKAADASGENLDYLEDAIRRVTFEEYISSLDYKHREVITLFYYDELSIKEIAEILGCFEGTVKSRLHTAKKQLRIQTQKSRETMISEQKTVNRQEAVNHG